MIAIPAQITILARNSSQFVSEAPDSLAAQSCRDPDGTGLGSFDADGAPRVDQAPIAAYLDQQFAQQAKERLSTTFIAHIHYATTGGLILQP